MNRLYRMVINLYKERCTANEADDRRSLEVLTEIAAAITTARIENKPTDELEALRMDVEQYRMAL